jgi:hypothetical protein
MSAEEIYQALEAAIERFGAPRTGPIGQSFGQLLGGSDVRRTATHCFQEILDDLSSLDGVWEKRR